jgi:hypothetical protein
MNLIDRIKMLLSIEGVPPVVTLGRIRDVLNGEAPEDPPQSIAPGPPLPEVYRGYRPVSEMTIEEHFVSAAFAALGGCDLSTGEIQDRAVEIANETIAYLVSVRKEEEADEAEERLQASRTA